MVVVVVVVVVEEVGIGQGHSITRCQVRRPFKEGHGLWKGPTGSVRWASGRAGVQGRAEVGPTSRWATQEGHVDPVHGQRRKVAKNKSKKSKGEGKRGRRNTFLIEYTLNFDPKEI